MAHELDKLKPLERFSGRVDYYSKYRPSYPREIINYLVQIAGLREDWAIADIGSGTGIFSQLLLENGYKVWGVEPNHQMRKVGEEQLQSYRNFTSVNGKAEHTSLTNQSIDLITVAQAFHWMEPLATQYEFQRILKPGGRIALLWNIRLTNTPFLKAFEELRIAFGTDYQATRMVSEKTIEDFFQPASMTYRCLANSQILDYEGIKGQLLSTSYAPLEGTKHDQMIAELEDIFERYQENGLVKIEYETKLYVNI